MQIISGSSNQSFAKKVALYSGHKILQTSISTFSNHEFKIEIQGNITKEVAIIQSTSHPANDHIMELLLLISAAKQAGAIEITAVIPYFGYSRQDKKNSTPHHHSPISAKLIAQLLETAGINKLVTIDLHSKTVENFFKVPVTNLSATSIFTLPSPCTSTLQFWETSFLRQKSILVAPDIGSIDRTRAFNALLGKEEIAIIDKTRLWEGNKSNNCSMKLISGNVQGENCIIIDDIVDTAETLCRAAELLKEKGALSVEAFITHAVLSNNAKERLAHSLIDKIAVSNSIYHPSLPDKFITICAARLVASAL